MAMQTLVPQSKGAEVLHMQQQLVLLGLISDAQAIAQIGAWAGGHAADAVYGSKTEVAVKAFQIALDLPRKDGTADAFTVQALSAICGGRGHQDRYATTGLQKKLMTLPLPACATLKEKLNRFSDQFGIFGPATESALEAFQIDKNIGNPRKQFGATTFKSLFAATATGAPSGANKAGRIAARNPQHAAYGDTNDFSPSNSGGQDLVGQCTWYAWGRSFELTGVKIDFTGTPRHGGLWPAKVKSQPGLFWSQVPRRWAVASWAGYSVGHVAFVEDFDPVSQTVWYSESNWNLNSRYNGVSSLPLKSFKSRKPYPHFNGFLYLP
jgi:peptidoglycan hydrolase-like protein with peptidoglycan-binding domain